jgi:hypothetical protein
VILHEHGEAWWNDIDRRKLQIRPPELSGNISSSYLVTKKELGKEMKNFAL